MEFLIFRKKKIPLMVAKVMLGISNYLIPLNKFNRDLSEAIFKHNNKK